ncbi:MAG: phage tail protein [Pyrinomonadaceae bacterium MAG19_C2-C3]|nr:phage tail protein [Pyrinomonadaceae bacterium MAG19_C2-C3]
MSLPIRFLQGLTTGAGLGSNRARGTAENRFIFEMDGVDEIRASKVAGLTDDHTPVNIALGNTAYDEQVRGRAKVEDVSVTVPSGINDTAIRQLARWHRDYVDGIDASPRNARLVVLDEAGAVEIETWELIDCVPRSIKPDDRSADGTGAAMTTIIIKPTRLGLL